MANLNRSRAVYCGSFDPLTLGHLDIIRRGAGLFDEVVVGIGINPDKRPLFSPAERSELITLATENLPNVKVTTFEGLAVDFAKSFDAGVLLRGVRSLSDTESEFTMALANSVLEPRLESVFLMANEQFAHISSTLIKQIAHMSTDGTREKLVAFVPECVIDPLLGKVSK
ncbi:MAG: pantetheine-phosphate adenylyltransferase [Planctomycetaceae bacterium]